VENYVEEFKEVSILFDKISCGQHKADLFRYYFLYVKGGVFFDDDAMIEIDIKEVIQDHKFFSVNSIAVKNSVFQGFIGCEPKNDIIYKALQDAYNIDLDELSKDYYLFCRNLYKIIQEDTTNDKIHLYKEGYYSSGAMQAYNEKNQTLLIHYWRDKTIPR